MSKETKVLMTPAQIQAGVVGDLPNLPALIQEAVKDIDLIVVDSDEKLPIANTRLERINELYKHVEDARKDFKAPIITAGKEVEAMANSYKIPLKAAKDKIADKILAWKTMQQSIIITKQAEVQKAQEVEAQRKQAEVELLDRVRAQINAKLYGGQYMTGAGTIVPCLPAKNVQEVTEVFLHFSQNFPMSRFAYMVKDAEKAYKELKAEILSHQKEIVGLVANGTLEAAIGAKKHSANNDRLIGKANAEETVAFETVKAEKSMANEVKAATKGVRKTLTFSITDINTVPREFMMINEVAMNEHIRNNKQAILDGIKVNPEVSAVPGIRFYEHSAYIAK